MLFQGVSLFFSAKITASPEKKNHGIISKISGAGNDRAIEKKSKPQQVWRQGDSREVCKEKGGKMPTES